jgi:hypothetical protein
MAKVWSARLSACAFAVVLLMAFPVSSPAASPTTGTVSVGSPAQWDFAPVGGLSASSDSYKLTVQLPASAEQLYALNAKTGTDYAMVLTIHLTWKGSNPDDALGLSGADPHNASVGNDTLATSNVNGDNNVFVIQNPLSQTYTITASNQLGVSSEAVPSHAVATLTETNLSDAADVTQPSGAPGFDDFRTPLDVMPMTPEEDIVLGGRGFGEPSVGVDPKTDAMMYQAGLFTMKGTFDDSTRPAKATWTNVSSPFTNIVTEDAILDVDRSTGRTFVSQLTAECSLSAVSDDDGASWTPAAKSCQTPPAVDHQTIGAGPFPAPLTGADPVYPDAVYYCSQNIAYAPCALSVDGGLNYGHGLSPMYTSADCFGIHGHVKVGPDGAIYVPNKACGSPECIIVTTTAGDGCHPGFAVSTDGGTTWTVHTINDGHTRYFNTGDPSIAIGPNNTIYYGYGDRDGHPKVVTCTDHGAKCGPSIDVGQHFNIANTEMATTVVGDDDRAAFAFLGSQTPGDDQQSNVAVTDANGNVINKVQPFHNFMGTWHVFVATTYDHGQHWVTSDATPDAPVQRGCIEFAASCPNSRGSDDQRNQLDFNDLTIDGEGRIVAAYTDGCQPDLGPPKNHGTCLDDASRLSGLAPELEDPAVARQSCGVGLYARFDGIMPACQ